MKEEYVLDVNVPDRRAYAFLIEDSRTLRFLPRIREVSVALDDAPDSLSGGASFVVQSHTLVSVIRYRFKPGWRLSGWWVPEDITHEFNSELDITVEASGPHSCKLQIVRSFPESSNPPATALSSPESGQRRFQGVLKKLKREIERRA